MPKIIKLNEDRLNAIGSFADCVGKLYDELSRMPNRIRKIAIGLSLDGSPDDNKSIRLNASAISAVTDGMEAVGEVSDDEYFNTLERLVDAKDDRVKISVCHNLIEELDSDIAAKEKTIAKLEERILLSNDGNSPEVKNARKRMDVFKNNLTIRIGRKVRVLEYFFKLRYAMLKAIVNSSQCIAACLITGDKYTVELSKRYDIKPLLKKIARCEDVFSNNNNTKGE